MNASAEGSACSPCRLLGSARGLGAGHTACAGCPAPSVVQSALHVAREGLGCAAVVVMATGCMESVTTCYPRNAWRVPFLHAGAGNVLAAAAGVAATLRARQARGELPATPPIKILAFGGDDDLHEAGLDAWAGAAARADDLTFIHYSHDAGLSIGGDGEPIWQPSDLARAAIALGVPYVAQAAVQQDEDLFAKLHQAMRTPGLSFVQVLASCPVDWEVERTDDLLGLIGLTVECGLWPLYVCEAGRYRVTYRPTPRRPVEALLQSHGGLRRLPVQRQAELRHRVEHAVDRTWRELDWLEQQSSQASV